MADYKYSMQGYNPEHMARVIGLSLPVSFKQCVEICNYIKGKNTIRAKQMLSQAINLEKPVPFKRFNESMGHKRGIASGKYPVKACGEILKLVESVEANAQFKGLSTANLIIRHICTQKASIPWHPGRQRRRRMKRAHVEIIVEESAAKEKKKQEPSIKTKPALGRTEIKQEKTAKKSGNEPKKEEKKMKND